MVAWILVARIGVVLAVVAVGLTASARDATYLLRTPRKLARAMLSMNVVMPLFAFATSALFELRRPVALALMTLAVAPIPPILPRRALQAGGAASYTVGLLVAASLASLVVVPLAVDVEAHVSALLVARVVALTILAPLAAGMAIRHFAARFAERAAKHASLVGLALVLVGLLPIFAAALPEMRRLIGSGTLATLLAFNVVGLAAGHFLGGPAREERTVLALTTASRHPGVALAVSSAIVSEPKPVVAALLLYLLLNLIVTLPYAAWSKRQLIPNVARARGLPSGSK